MSDETSGYPGAPPDWYPDPAGGPGQRWWDGYAWTDAVVLPTPTLPPASGPAPGGIPQTPMRGYGTAGYETPSYSAPSSGYTTTLLNEELRTSLSARVWVIIIAAYFMWDALSIRIQSGLYRSIGHQEHLAIVAQDHHRTAPPIHITNQGSALVTDMGGLLFVAAIVAVIFACRWQHRAASTARAIGLPAKHSPGWGVGSWFVPIVHLWMPYQALRDCLPADDPNRRLVKVFGACFAAQLVLLEAAFIIALSSSTLSIFFCLPAALLCLGMISTGPRIITAIAAAHQKALGQPQGVTPV